MILSQEQIGKFWSRVDKHGDIPSHKPELGRCWVWTSTKSEFGYGLMNIRNRNVRAHRIAMDLAGEVIDGKVVMHMCDNPSCVRVDHLRTGSRSENVADMVAKGRQARGEGKRIKLTSASVVEMRRMVSSGASLRDVAGRFGCSRSQACLVANSKAWRHVVGP